MIKSSLEPVAEGETVQLTDPAAVIQYLQSNPLALRVIDVQRLHGGIVNFVYRLILDHTIGNAQQKTAILKYAAPYVAEDPSVSFSPDRQIYEVRALQNIPWKQFRDSSPPEIHGSLCKGVILPEVYFENLSDHVIIMQDCNTEIGENWNPEKAADSFRFFSEQVSKSESKYQTARAIGSMLGRFLAQLHDWGRSSNNHAQAEELFGANDEPMKLIIQVHLTDLFDSVSKIGYKLNQKQKNALEKRIPDLRHALLTQRDTVILADLR
jgi:hypothetical protein